MVKELAWDGVEVKRGRSNFNQITVFCSKARVQKGVLHTGFSRFRVTSLNLRFIITSAPNGKDFYLTGVGGGKFSPKLFFK